MEQATLSKLYFSLFHWINPPSPTDKWAYLIAEPFSCWLLWLGKHFHQNTDQELIASSLANVQSASQKQLILDRVLKFLTLEIIWRINSKWSWGRNVLWWWWWGTGTGCPEKLWMPHPWKCSRPDWMGPWAIWSRVWQGWCIKDPFQPKPLHVSMVQWRRDYFKREKERELGLVLVHIQVKLSYAQNHWRGEAHIIMTQRVN